MATLSPKHLPGSFGRSGRRRRRPESSEFRRQGHAASYAVPQPQRRVEPREGSLGRTSQPSLLSRVWSAGFAVPVAPALSRAEGGVPRLRPPIVSHVESGARALVPVAPASSRAEGGVPRPRPPIVSHVESGARASVPVAPASSRAGGGIPRLHPPVASRVESGARASVPAAPAGRAEGVISQACDPPPVSVSLFLFSSWSGAVACVWCVLLCCWFGAGWEACCGETRGDPSSPHRATHTHTTHHTHTQHRISSHITPPCHPFPGCLCHPHQLSLCYPYPCVRVLSFPSSASARSHDSR
jgi:hypothetical protein